MKVFIPNVKEAEENLSELEESIQSIKFFDDAYNNESIDDIRRLFDFL